LRARACLLLWRPLWMLCKLKKEKKKETNERHRKQAHSSFLFFFLYFLTPSSPSHSLSLILIISQELGKKESAPQTRCWFRSLGRSQKGKKEHKQQGEIPLLSRALFFLLSRRSSSFHSHSLSQSLVFRGLVPCPPPPPSARKESDNIKGKGRNGGIQGGEESSLSSQSLFFWQKKKRACFFCFFRLVFVGRIPRGGRKRRSKVQKGFS